jgi:ADP-ribose pyrophosphatase
LITREVVGPDGRGTTKEIVEHPGAVVIIPWVDHERICLVQNHRHAIGRTLLELPAGTREPAEPPEATARRELAEETGYRADRWSQVLEFYPSPGVLSEKMFLFVATGLTAGLPKLDAGEDLRPVVLTWADALRQAVHGEIQDAKTLVGLLWWDRRRASQNS